jgi:hypothetical protein
MDGLAKVAAAFRAALEQTPSDKLPIASVVPLGDATDLLDHYLKTHGDPDQDRHAYHLRRWDAKQALRAPVPTGDKPSSVLLSRASYGTYERIWLHL